MRRECEIHTRRRRLGSCKRCNSTCCADMRDTTRTHMLFKAALSLGFSNVYYRYPC